MEQSKMHLEEIETSCELVRRLLAAQFPNWAELSIAPVFSSGTDNALFRLGPEMVVRMPRVHWAAGQPAKEFEWLPKLAPHLPLPIPIPIALGQPGEGYPWEWSICPWLDGEDAATGKIYDLIGAAEELGRFVRALHAVDPTGGPPPGDHNSGRGVPLRDRDERVRAAISSLEGMIDTAAVTRAWEMALDTPEWSGLPVWIHGDIQPTNLLVEEGKLSAVIDFGCLAVGDPACDLMIAWTLFSGESREVFRRAVGVDEATWLRGKGWALSCALIYMPYYRDTNPTGVEHALSVVEECINLE